MSEYKTRAYEVMNRQVITVRSDDLISHVVKKIVEHDVSGIPVVNHRDELVGIISETDILNHDSLISVPDYLGLIDSMLYSKSPEKYRSEIEKTLKDTVKSTMSRKVFTADKNTSIGEISLKMSNRDVNRVVITEDKKILGIIARRDITKIIYQMIE